MKCCCMFACFIFTCSMAQMLAINFHKGFRSPKPLENDARSMNTSSLYFEQILDHYDPFNEDTWMQRYWENGTYYRTGSPVLLLMGGEEAGDPSWMTSGAWHTYAKDLNAMMFMLEHRFFGESRPTNDTSLSNLEYLTVEQVLADTVHFIDGMNKKYNYTDSTKWIAIGGSYSGNLAVWLRMKYPHLVHATIASSAPLLAKLDYEDYLISIGEFISRRNDWCGRRLRLAFEELDTMLESDVGRMHVSTKMNLCDWLSTREEDIAIFYVSVVSHVAFKVQSDPDDGSGYVKLLCDYMTNTTRWKKKTSSVERYLEYMKVAMNIEKNNATQCVPANFDVYYDFLGQSEWEIATAFGMLDLVDSGSIFHVRSWDTIILQISIAACSVDVCLSDFSLKPAIHCSDMQIEAIYRTNLLYGGWNNKVSNVIYVSGTADPWYPLCIHDVNSNGYRPYRVIVIKGGYHCSDMFDLSDNDSVELKDAREQIRNTIRTWIGQNY